MKPHRKQTPLVVTLWIILAALTGCSSDDDGVHGPPSYMAISGGGFRSQVAQAAWTMGMMTASGSDDLEDLMKNIDAVASNSGGTWFITQLAFSESFRTALEMPIEYGNNARRPEKHQSAITLPEQQDISTLSVIQAASRGSHEYHLRWCHQSRRVDVPENRIPNVIPGVRAVLKPVTGLLGHPRTGLRNVNA